MDREELFRAYIESFEWRNKICVSVSELLKLCENYSLEYSVLWDQFINNSVKTGHLLNADALHNTLKGYSLANRDYVWTTFINGKTTDEERLIQLIQLYNKGDVLEGVNKEQIRLLLVFFSWILTSSNRWLRDTVSKAMIEILKENFEYVGSMEEDVSYEGPWNPYVRDFDPTLNEHNLVCEDVPIFVEVKEHMMNEIQEIKRAKDDPSFDEEIWINTVPTFYENQKEDLLLTDKSGIQWVALSKYADTGKVDLAYNKLLIWNWLYGYFVTDEQLVTLKKYADKKVNLINSDIRWIPETYTIYNREYPWSSGSKSIEELQWENIKVETGEMKSIIETVEEPQFSYAEILQKKYLGEFDEDKKWDELGTALDEKISIPVVCKKYTREEPMTVGLGRVLNSCQDLIWEEEFDASKEETISVSHPCAEIIKVLGLSQKKYDGYYCNKAGELIAFDTALTKQKAGLIIRKDALDEFLSIKNFHLVWFVNASKEIHDESLMIKKYTDWTGLLEYKGDFVEGEYYITEYR